ncbi:MAG: FKBP-type peptidyl-prolyl cis-trans isomerase [Salinibacterium sp.]|nr:FKBP-type peptidyl-prolyl cis-trans isomerase [Salinibacterium sp.]
MRKLVGVALAAGLLASLAACSSTPTPYASCTSTGNATLVTAAGALGADPQATFPTPLVAKNAELSILVKGDGRQVTPDEGVQLTLSIYDAATGAAIQTKSGGPLTGLGVRLFVTDGAFPFTAAMSCATEGSRVISTGTAEQLFGSDAIGLDPKSSLVVVSDITSAFLGKANGADQIPQAGYPAVVLAPNGRPGITFPAGPIPGGLGAVALKQGNGTVVKEGDRVIANMTGVVWGAKKTFLSTWDSNAPSSLTAQEIAPDGTGLPAGLAKAVIGQKVGSQLLVVVSGADSYPAGQAPTGVADGDTLVFVFDILGIG